MKIIQVMPSIAFGDATSNDAIAIKSALENMGYTTAIYAENIDPKLPKHLANRIGKLANINEQDIIIYHLAIGCDLNYKIAEYPCKLIIRYHNVTPPYFFEGYNETLYRLCNEGLKGVRYLAKRADYCLADSEFNKKDLIRMGYTCKIDVMPILIPFEDYKKQPSDVIIKKYKDDYVNILFTGRIAPNKKQEDIIAAFYYYNTYINKKSRLFLVGSYNGMEEYYDKLCEYVKQIGVQNVCFTGHISFADILAYYSIADVFLCMSEHEGFCVPLPEAMAFDVPIIAYDSCAIKGTLGGSGFLLEEKNPIIVAKTIEYLLTHEELKKTILENQRERLEDFQYKNVYQLLEKYLKQFVGKQ